VIRIFLKFKETGIERSIKMPKRKPLIFCTLLFTIVALLAATQVMAQSVPITCSDGTFTMTTDPGDFPSFEPGSPTSPGLCGEVDGYRWNYTVSVDNPKDMNALTKMHFYAPSYPPNKVKVIQTSAVHIELRGEGALNSTFGEGIYNGISWSTTPYSGTATETQVSFCTETGTVGLISPAFVGSRFIRGCESEESDDQGPLGGIAGPGFAPVLPTTTSATTTWTVSEGDQTCTILAVTGSPPTVTVTGDCEPVGDGYKRVEEIIIDGKSAVSVPLNQWIKTHGSPGTFTYCTSFGYCYVVTF
jgi:hypothetical protein